MIRRWCLYLAMLLGCLILMIAYQGWLAWMLLMAVVCTPLFSLAVSLPAMLSACVEADCSGAVSVGTQVTAKVRTSCRFPMPAYRCKFLVTRTPTGESMHVKLGQALPTEHCGQLVCRLQKCYVYDYLNLFRLKVRKSAPSSVIVEPKAVKMAEPEALERQFAHGWKPKPGGGFAENHEMRLYRPGDGLNQVHWKLTAKTGKLIVREAMEPLRRRLVLALEIQGDGAQLDIKMGKLLWLGEYLLEKQLHFEIHALARDGVICCTVTSQQELAAAMQKLLCAEPAEGEQTQSMANAAWSCHIGGGTDEA